MLSERFKVSLGVFNNNSKVLSSFKANKNILVGKRCFFRTQGFCGLLNNLELMLFTFENGIRSPAQLMWASETHWKNQFFIMTFNSKVMKRNNSGGFKIKALASFFDRLANGSKSSWGLNIASNSRRWHWPSLGFYEFLTNL